MFSERDFKMDFLKNAKRLPVIDWNLTFFGGHEQLVDNGWTVPIEKHYAFECVYCLEGTESVKIRDNLFLLNPGDFVIIPPEFTHRVWTETSLKYFCFHFDLDDPNLKIQLIKGLDYFYDSNSQLCRALTPHLNKLDDLTKNLNYNFDTKMVIQIELSKILQIFYQLADQRISKSTTTQAEYARMIAEFLKNNLIDQIILYSKNGFENRDLGRNLVQEAIAHAEISDGYGFRVFKQTYGISPREYLSKLKINEAKKLLMKPNYSILEIGESLGYTSISNFSRQFKRWTGLSPREFQQKSRR